jgi:Cytochrome c552
VTPVAPVAPTRRNHRDIPDPSQPPPRRVRRDRPRGRRRHRAPHQHLRAQGRGAHAVHPRGRVGEDDTDPARWGKNWPAELDSYQRTAITTRTRFGGNGGNEAVPQEKIDRDPWLKRMFLGYAFSIDYRDRRGHAYMLADQEATQRLTKPQSGSCLHCHASIMPLYRKLGGGDPCKDMDETAKQNYQEVSQMLHDRGDIHPVSCVDCHDSKTMALRVTRPGFIRGIQAFAASDAAAPALSSILEWRKGKRDRPYDPNTDGSRNEMRSFVCGQCHVEYYCSTKLPLTFPWGRGLRVEEIEAFWDATRFPDGSAFYDYEHQETGAHVLKAQHPEFELWNQGIHARSGVSCADCHMPYMREGATKVSDHWVRSPLLNVNRVPDLPPVPRGRVARARRRHPAAQLRPLAARRPGARRLARCGRRGQGPWRHARSARRRAPAPAPGAVAARLHRGGEQHGLPRAPGSRARARRGGRLRAARPDRSADGGTRCTGRHPRSDATICALSYAGHSESYAPARSRWSPACRPAPAARPAWRTDEPRPGKPSRSLLSEH